MKLRMADAVVLAAVACWALLGAVWANDLVGGDEGYYVTMARNLLAEPRQWAAVSLSPLGEAGDKPPLVPALLALASLPFGVAEWALRLVPLASTALAMLAGVRLAAALSGSRAALAAAVLLATLPWLADGARVIAAEPTLAALALWALVLLVREPLTSRRAALAGALLGLAFLCKTWLVVLVAVPAALAMIGRPGRLWLAAGLPAALVASLHLIAVLALTPRDLPHWMNVVFGMSLGARAAGQGFADYWLQPPWFYAGILAKAMAVWLPLLVLGVAAAWRRRAHRAARALLGAFLSLALLSAFRVKAGGYLHPLVPMLAALAAVGAAAWSPTAQAGLGRWRPRIVAALLLLACVTGALRIVQRLPQRYHDPGYREVAAYLAPRLAGAAPSDTVLIAPEAPAFQALLFHRADYWDTPYRPWTPERAARLRSGGGPRWWVIDAGGGFYGGTPDSATVAWISRAGRDVTPEIERSAGRALGVRVFERAP